MAKVHKRVVLKVWQQDGVVHDNAHEIEWLERKGWTVVCSEPLLDASAEGAAYVLYLLARDEAATTPPKLAEPKEKIISCPNKARQIVLSCAITRGRILVREIDPAGSEYPIGPAKAAPAPGTAAGFVTLDFNNLIGTRVIGIVCVNDAEPLPATDSSAEAPAALVRVDALFGGEQLPVGTDSQPVIASEEVKPGEAVTYYVWFQRG